MDQTNLPNDIFDVRDSPVPKADQKPETIFSQKLKNFYQPRPIESNPNNPSINNEPPVPAPLEKELPKKNKGRFIFTLSLIIFLLIAGGAAAAYVLFIKISPDKLADLMVKKMLATKSYAYNGELTLAGQQNLSLKFFGNTDNNNDQLTKNSLVLNANIASDLGNIKPELEIRLINNETFFRINLSGLPLTTLLNDQFNNQWLKITSTDAQNNPSAPINQSNFNITPGQITNLKNLFHELDFFENLKELGQENLNQAPTRHLSFDLSKAVLEKFIIEAYNQFSKAPLASDQLTDLHKNISDLSLISGEIWIGSKDFYLYKLRLPINWQMDSEVANEAIAGNLEINFEKFNGSFTIDPPVNYANLSEVLNNLNIQPAPTIDPNLDSDNDGLKDGEEDFYHTDKFTADSDQDGYNDGEEVENGYNPLGPGKL